MSEMDARFDALAAFMEWVDPAGYAAALADVEPINPPGQRGDA